MSTYADWQSIQQWTGDPLAQGTGVAIAGGTVDTGVLQVGSWASIIVWAKATAQPVTAVVTQTIANGPAPLTISQTLTWAPGSQSAQSIIMFGTAVEIVFTGGGVGCVLDYAIVPSNTTVATSVSSVPVITRVTALPGAPSDTQVVAFVPDAVAFPGVEWLCIYNASTGFWDVLGAAELFVYDAADYAKAAQVGFADLGSTSLVLAREGWYDCHVEADVQNTGGSAAESTLALSIDGVLPASAYNAADVYTGGTGPQVSVGRDYYNLHIAAGGVVKCVYASQLTTTFHHPKFTVKPRRIK